MTVIRKVEDPFSEISRFTHASIGCVVDLTGINFTDQIEIFAYVSKSQKITSSINLFRHGNLVSFSFRSCLQHRK